MIRTTVAILALVAAAKAGSVDQSALKGLESQLISFFKSTNGGRRLNAAESEAVAGTTDAIARAMETIKEYETKAADNLKSLPRLYGSDQEISNALSKVLGDFGYSSSVSNMFDGTVIHDLITADTIEEAQQVIEDAEAQLCTPEDTSDAGKKPTECTGPEIKLVYEPKACTIDSLTHSIDCKPAKLVLKKVAGGCTFKHHTPFKWTGKVCKVKAEFGKTVNTDGSKGGEPYTLFIDGKNKTANPFGF